MNEKSVMSSLEKLDFPLGATSFIASMFLFIRIGKGEVMLLAYLFTIVCFAFAINKYCVANIQKTVTKERPANNASRHIVILLMTSFIVSRVCAGAVMAFSILAVLRII